MKPRLMKVLKVCQIFRITSVAFTSVYMWVAACHYLAAKGLVGGANGCFYGGIATAFFWLVTSPRVWKYAEK